MKVTEKKKNVGLSPIGGKETVLAKRISGFIYTFHVRGKRDNLPTF